MKKILNLTLTIMLMLELLGCVQQNPSVDVKFQEAETTATLETTKPPETTAQETVPAEIIHPTEPEETNPTQWMDLPETTEKTESTTPPVTKPTQSESEPTNPPTSLPAETEPPETQPPATEPLEMEQSMTEPTESPATEPVPNPTEPPTEATEPPAEPPYTEPTEPAGCQHEWICVNHNEEGHWKAGVICDCGWIVYGDPDELPALWNAHSASYPAAESLFEHGGYGSMDEWIVDKPAYGEWICQYCGESKP